MNTATNPKLSTDECLSLFNKANLAGFAAANSVVPPEYKIVEVDVLTGQPKPGARDYRMTGTCGFAWVNVKPANSRFAKWLVAGQLARKSAYYGGVQVWVSQFGQCMEMKEAYARAFAKVLSDAGINCYSDSRMD